VKRGSALATFRYLGIYMMCDSSVFVQARAREMCRSERYSLWNCRIGLENSLAKICMPTSVSSWFGCTKSATTQLHLYFSSVQPWVVCFCTYEGVVAN
jgi:hypothetical protein